jgi:NifB/MoaA-like Fe-S oxidoreductase
VPVALTRYNTDARLTRVTPEFCRRTIREVEKLQREFRKTLGVTFAFLGDEIYLKAGLDVPSRRHYGNYPQIEDGVGMVRSFLNGLEKLLKAGTNVRQRAEAVELAKQFFANARTHPEARTPATPEMPYYRTFMRKRSRPLFGTILTGEMFAPILAEQIDAYNRLNGTRLEVLAVPNTYFGGDVAVAGLLTGQDYLGVKDRVKGDFVIIPKHTIKSDEPILLDGMMYEELRSRFPVPMYDMDSKELIAFLAGKRF